MKRPRYNGQGRLSFLLFLLVLSIGVFVAWLYRGAGSASEKHEPSNPGGEMLHSDRIPPSIPTKPRVDFPLITRFYDQHGNQMDSPQPRAIAIHEAKWWLQIVVLNDRKEAEALKAALIALKLSTVIQSFERNGKNLHRVRVGPYQHEDDALEDLDTLASNNFEPRLIRDQNK